MSAEHPKEYVVMGKEALGQAVAEINQLHGHVPPVPTTPRPTQHPAAANQPQVYTMAAPPLPLGRPLTPPPPPGISEDVWKAALAMQGVSDTLHAVPNMMDSKYLEYNKACENKDALINTKVNGLLFWGVVFNICMYLLYREAMGKTKEEYQEKIKKDEFIAAFFFICLLNFLLFIMLFISYEWVAEKAQGGKYILFYGWIGGIRRRCGHWTTYLFTIVFAAAYSFLGLWIYLLSVTL